MKFSEQAEILKKNLKDFDIDDFKAWHKKHYAVGSVEILTYIMERDD